MNPEVLEKTICINCNEFDRCIETMLQPIFFCEEYDNYVNVQKNFFADEEKTFINDEKIDLHMNCDNKTFCMYRRNDNTIKLYCEEH